VSDATRHAMGYVVIGLLALALAGWALVSRWLRRRREEQRRRGIGHEL
jgi:hypothetical protein